MFSWDWLDLSDRFVDAGREEEVAFSPSNGVEDSSAMVRELFEMAM